MGMENEYEEIINSIDSILIDQLRIGGKKLIELANTQQYVQPIEPMNVVCIREYANGVQISNTVMNE